MLEADAIKLFKCLADKSRLQILKSLIKEEMYVERLAERLGLTPATISFHVKKLEEAGAQLIVDTLVKIEKGEITPVPQDESKASYVKMMKKTLGKIDWSKEAVVIERLVRGLNSWPSAYTFFEGKSLKLWSCDVLEETCSELPGTIERVNKDSIDVATGKGMLRILELQLEGKKRMDTKSFLLGNAWKAGMCLGEKQN